ncbi:MAG: myo-inositol catabolism protein [Candidatus Bathyarchaeota archaeon B26-2]|nr:MAG: myo-inositol catabolism protein [Candidatus Bathyarchaeota archaeon B26-2]
MGLMERRGYLYKGAALESGYTLIVGPENSELRLLEFGRLILSEKGDEFFEETGDREAVLTIFKGLCSIEVESQTSEEATFTKIGGRTDVFSGKPVMLYLPSEVSYRVVAESPGLDIGISTAPSDAKWPPVLVRPEDVEERTVGAWNWRRTVYLSVGENVEAERLIVGETINPPGNWSSSPPHKHDTMSESEAPYEEIYFFKVKPSQGFGIQRIYTVPEDPNPIDEVYVVEDDDTVVIPRGYHPVVAAPGYQLYYLWILAGEERRYGAWSDDPKHKWLRDCEAIIHDILS